jgi:hypothetical protein
MHKNIRIPLGFFFACAMHYIWLDKGGELQKFQIWQGLIKELGFHPKFG